MPTYVIVTECGKEAKVVTKLADQRINAYAPTAIRKHYVAGHARSQFTPIFPRYVFVNTNELDRDFAAIRHGTPHVVAFLAMNGKPHPIPETWLAQFLLIQTFGGFDYTQERRPKMRVGQCVRIIGGQFQSYLGVITSFRNGKAVVDAARGGSVLIKPDQLRAA